MYHEITAGLQTEKASGKYREGFAASSVSNSVCHVKGGLYNDPLPDSCLLHCV